MSTYTVIFNDGDEKTLKRSFLRFKGERHFLESETLNNSPLTHPEHFLNPVKNQINNLSPTSINSASNTNINQDSNRLLSSNNDSDDSYEDYFEIKPGNVVVVEKKASWYAALVVKVKSQKTCVTVRNFKDGKL